MGEEGGTGMAACWKGEPVGVQRVKASCGEDGEGGAGQGNEGGGEEAE